MIQLQSATFSYSNDQGSQSMFFELSVDKTEKLAVIGASGSGKSTLLNLIAGFNYVEQGQVYLNGEDCTYKKPYERPVSMLFQDNNLFNHLSVFDNITLGLQPKLKTTLAQRQHIEQIADKVGLLDYLERHPGQLSGGQQQRVALARCLLRDKPILLLDEPFSALDKALRIEMLALLDDICQQKQLTLLMVTHQPDELSGFITRTVTLNHGQILSDTSMMLKR